jgi:MFS family permease
MALSANRLFLTVVLGGQSMANIDTAIINVATPSIGRTLGASGAELQLTVSVYILATAMLLVTAARLGVLYGYRRVFIAGIVTFTLASLACGIAPEILSLIVARIVQGAGAALMIAQVMSGIQRTLTGDARTRAIGAYTTTLSLGAVIGQILGGLLITLNLFGLAWRPLFLINVPIGLVLLAVAWFALPHDLPHAGARPKLDLIGVTLLAVGMLLLVLPLTIGREMQWPWWTIVSLLACIPTIAAFIWWQKTLGERGGAPLLNLPLFHDRMVVSGLTAQMFGRVTYFGILFVLALYVQVGLGESALVSGLSLIGWVVAYGLAGPVYPRLSRRLTLLCGPLGGLVMASAFAGTAILAALHVGIGPLFIAVLACGGFGWGLFSTAMTAQLSAIVAPEHAPDLSGVLATMQPLSAVIGVAVFGSEYLALSAAGGAASAMHAFAILNATFVVAALAAAVLSLNGPRAALRASPHGSFTSTIPGTTRP